MDKNNIFSKINGNGVPLIFLHGWGVDSNLFNQLSILLQDIRECHLIDLPGFGNSPKPEEVWGTLDYAQCIIKYMDEHEIEKADILGHSVGGRIALRIACHYPKRVNSLILIASAGIKSKKFRLYRMKIFLIKKLSKIFKAIDKIIGNDFFKKNFAHKFASQDYKNAGEMKDIFLKIVNEDQENELNLVKAKTLLIWGDRDAETPSDMAETFLKKIDGSKLILLKGRDHFPFLGSGANLCSFYIKEFLQQ